MAGAFCCICRDNFQQKAQRSWRCRGLCGLVKLDLGMQRHMTCISPSKLQHAQPNAELTQGVRSGSLVNLLAAPVLSLGRGGDVKIKIAPWWGLWFWPVSLVLLFGKDSDLLGDATRGYLVSAANPHLLRF